MGAKQEIGRAGEALAEAVLAERGYQIVDRNWRGTRGELDLIALDGGTLAVVEVKTRTGARFGHPAEAVTPRKLAQIRRLTGQWVAEHRDLLPERRQIRIDVVAVTLDACGASAPVVDLRQGISS